MTYSYGGTTDIPFTGSSQWAQTATLYKYKLDTTQDTSTSRFFELYDLRNGANVFISPASYGMEISVDTSTGVNTLSVNTSDNTNDPYYFGDATGGNLTQTKVITASDVGTTIYCYRSNGTDNNASFTVVSGMLWTQSGGQGGQSGGGGNPVNPQSTGSSTSKKVFHNFW